jgi:hypothetical protein
MAKGQLIIDHPVYPPSFHALYNPFEARGVGDKARALAHDVAISESSHHLIHTPPLFTDKIPIAPAPCAQFICDDNRP